MREKGWEYVDDGEKKEREKRKRKKNVVRGWWGKKERKKKKKRGTGTEGRERGKNLRKESILGTCEKNKYIKKWNSKVKIRSLV
jgi:hypothetical protein